MVGRFPASPFSTLKKNQIRTTKTYKLNTQLYWKLSVLFPNSAEGLIRTYIVLRHHTADTRGEFKMRNLLVNIPNSTLYNHFRKFKTLGIITKIGKGKYHLLAEKKICDLLDIPHRHTINVPADLLDSLDDTKALLLRSYLEQQANYEEKKSSKLHIDSNGKTFSYRKGERKGRTRKFFAKYGIELPEALQTYSEKFTSQQRQGSVLPYRKLAVGLRKSYTTIHKRLLQAKKLQLLNILSGYRVPAQDAWWWVREKGGDIPLDELPDILPLYFFWRKGLVYCNIPNVYQLQDLAKSRLLP